MAEKKSLEQEFQQAANEYKREGRKAVAGNIFALSFTVIPHILLLWMGWYFFQDIQQKLRNWHSQFPIDVTVNIKRR